MSAPTTPVRAFLGGGLLSLLPPLSAEGKRRLIGEPSFFLGFANVTERFCPPCIRVSS
jgi:hypothetical protein